MKSLCRNFLAVVAPPLVFCFTAYPTRAQQDLEIQMQLTKGTILLGEPDWVDVSVTNRSNGPLRYDMGVDCPSLGGSPPLKVEVSAAEPGDGEPKPCFYAGNCLMSYPPPELAPGETFTRRYVLSGDFRIVQPGRYDVALEKTVNYGPSPRQHDLSTPFPIPDQETAKLHVTLVVLPPDRQKLLVIERDLAKRVTGPMSPPPIPAPPIGQQFDKQTAESYVRAREKAEFEEMETRDSIAKGLATYPAAGMEPIFDDWMISEHRYEGLPALLKLNTPSARRFIAEAADPSPEILLLWRQHVYVDGTPERTAATASAFESWRAEAVTALGKTGDKSYVAFLERLTRDPNYDVRSSAIVALGRLGGEKALRALTDIARHGTRAADRQNAVGSMAYAQSLKAVPILIDLITLPNSGRAERLDVCPLGAHTSEASRTGHAAGNSSSLACMVEDQQEDRSRLWPIRLFEIPMRFSSASGGTLGEIRDGRSAGNPGQPDLPYFSACVYNARRCRGERGACFREFPIMSLDGVSTDAKPSPSRKIARLICSYSSAAAHLNNLDPTGLLGMKWWRDESPRSWGEVLDVDQPDVVQELRQCTYASRPFGTKAFVKEIGERIGRTWVPG